ncbi:MAG: hypothetical protein NDI59_02700 [Lysobacter sp.]|nr:hypothetical protein [Lysobacter sp.]
MSLTLGLTGMDPDTESALRQAFSEASAELGGLWTLEPENDASFVVVDMDTLYGPMSWLRLHAAEKSVIGLTAATRTQADYRLERPFSAQTLVAVLGEIAQSLGQTVAPAVPKAAVTAATADVPAPPQPESEPVEVASLAVFADLADSIPSGSRDTASPAPAAAETSPMGEPFATPVPDVPAPATLAAPMAPAAPEASYVPVTPVAPAVPDAPATPAAPAAPTTLAGWLASGQLRGRQRLRNGQLSVLVDPAAQVYFGPSALKPLAELFAKGLDGDRFEPVDDAAWQQDTAPLGSAQPLSRLVWFEGLLGSAGSLAAGYDPNDRFHLLKWPQTEREYPKHFRIATVMMKGPATLAEITEASGVAREDVNDFVNASLATGFAQPYREPEPEPEAPKSGGLFGRLRGR